MSNRSRLSFISSDSLVAERNGRCLEREREDIDPEMSEETNSPARTSSISVGSFDYLLFGFTVQICRRFTFVWFQASK